MIKNSKFILKSVAHYHGLSVKDILGPSRSQHIFSARLLSMKIMRDILGMSYSSIAEELNRDHSTVIKNLKSYKSNLQVNALFAIFKSALNKTATKEALITKSMR